MTIRLANDDYWHNRMTQLPRTPDAYITPDARPFWRGYATALEDMSGSAQAQTAAAADINDALARSAAHDAELSRTHGAEVARAHIPGPVKS